MAELYGTPLGFQANADLEHTQATTRLDLANAHAAEVKAQQDQVMMDLARGAAANIGTDADPIDKIQKISGRMLDLGFYNQGTAMAGKAEQMRLQRQQALTSGARQQLDKIGADIKEHEEVGNFLGMSLDPETGQPDPQRFQQAKMIYMANHPKEPLPKALETFNPQLIDMLSRSTAHGLASLREREKTLHDETTELQRDADREERKAAREFRANMEEKNIRLREQLRSQRAKSEGKTPVVGAPNRDMIQAAQALLQELHPGLKPDMQIGKDLAVSSAAYDIASLAKSFMTKNRGLSASEAMQQAEIQLAKEGRFQEEPGKEGFKVGPLIFGDTKPTTKYSRKGGPTAALESGPILDLPPKGKPVPPGKYRTAKGVVIWDGKSGRPYVSGGSGPVSGAVDDEPADEGVRTP